MKKRHSHADSPEQFIAHLAKLRGEKEIVLIQGAIELYDSKVKPLLAKGLGIADILLALGLDNETLAAALAYPALQAREIHADTITDCFGESANKLLHDVLQMQSLAKLQHVEQRGSHQIENLRKMLLAMVTDVRAVLIVLAERLWQLRQIKDKNKTEQQQLAQETLDVYAPLANRLGVWQLKWEIEDLCFRYLQPEIYSQIAKWLASRRDEREAYIQQFITDVTNILNAADIKQFQVSGRVKHIYSIYRKMQRKASAVHEIYDITALRVLVENIEDCYAVLSVIQNVWQQFPEEFDDYIAQPKPNGYRSIHTVVVGPENRFIEIQIRTQQMHNESELGVAAHWRYKEGVLQKANYEAKIALLRQVMAWQKEVVGQANTNQSLQDLFVDRIYVFTPTGDIIDLPQGATPLDFAYYIHSEVGHRCRGAKIDGSIVPLTHPLQTGERVEILTAKQPNPSRDWTIPKLGYTKTSRARNSIHHWFKVKDSAQNIADGRDLLEKEIKRLNIDDKYDLQAIAVKLNLKTCDDLLAGLATGDVRITQIMHHIRPSVATTPTFAPRQSEPASSIQILGINNLLTHIARCCKPLPGDAVIGYVTRTRGVSIHRHNCGSMLHVTKENQQRVLEVDWNEKTPVAHPVDLHLQVDDRSGILREITTLLAGEKINVIGLLTQKGQQASQIELYLTIEITNVQQLKKAIALLKQVPNVFAIRRV